MYNTCVTCAIYKAILSAIVSTLSRKPITRAITLSYAF